MNYFKISCGFALAILLAGCQHEEKPEPESGPKVAGETISFATNSPQLTSITVQTAETRRVAVSHLTGRLYWSDDATVRIFTPVAGRVSALRADIGEAVSPGAALAEIDSPDFGQARADARTAEGNMRAAEKAFAREKELFAHGAAAQKDVETAEAAAIAAASERDRALARLALYGGTDTNANNLYVLRSPVGGVVVEKNINPGQEVRSDQMLANAPQLFAPLFVVSDPTKLWLQLDVSESDLSAIQPGQQLRIYSRAFPEKVFDGVIDNISAELDPATRAVKVRGTVNNAGKLLKAEMYVLADVVMNASQSAQPVVEISAKAVFMRENQNYLFVEESPGTYRRQSVKIDGEHDGKIPVVEGISAGQKVVTDGCLLLEALLESGGKS